MERTRDLGSTLIHTSHRQDPVELRLETEAAILLQNSKEGLI